jgi:glutathione S-transferase
MENIPIFLLVSLAYIHTLPNPALCHSLFWIFTSARFLHSFVYAFFPLPQPIRTLLYFVGVIVTVFMIFANFVHFINYL